MEIAEAVSPCVKQCALTEDRSQCRACGRTLEEIRTWKSMTNDERLSCIDLARNRIPV